MATSLIEFQNQNTNNQQNTQQQTGSTTANTYNPNQTNLQSLLPMLYSQLAGGSIPQSFTDPAAMNAQFNQNFQNTVAPQLAAQYGPGSPQIASQETQGEVNLAGNEYNQGVTNYQNTLSGGTNNAYANTGNNQVGANLTNQSTIQSVLASLIGSGSF